MTRVNCSVKTCSYWGQGEVCNADSIWVKNDTSTRAGGNMAYSQYTEFADDLQPDIGANANQQASGSHDTCCETMKPKGQSSGMNQSTSEQQGTKHVHSQGCGCGDKQGK
jgi:hypothetical protein